MTADRLAAHRNEIAHAQRTENTICRRYGQSHGKTRENVSTTRFRLHAEIENGRSDLQRPQKLAVD